MVDEPATSGAPSRERVMARVRELLAQQEELDPQGVRPEGELERDLGMDSLSRVELQMALEDAFGAELDESVAASIRTVDQAVDAVITALGRARSASPPAPPGARAAGGL